MPTNTTKLTAALHLASLGFRVFRLQRDGKKPFASGWQEEATNDPDAIRLLFEGHDYNIGVYTERHSSIGSLAVVDVDTKDGKQGDATMDYLENTLAYDFPPSFTVTTASGGRHIYYYSMHPLQSGANKIGMHVDLKSAGGYVVGPGSIINNKPYSITNALSLADIPAWIEERVGRPIPKLNGHAASAIEVLDSQATIDRVRSYLATTAPAAIQGAAGNDTTFKIALRCKDFGLSEHQTLEEMFHLWNPTHATPPWDFEELEKLIANAYRYSKKQTGNLSPQAEFTPIYDDNNGRTKWITSFDAAALPPRPWLLGRDLLSGYVTSLVAPGGVGKSTLTLSWAAALAATLDLTNATPHQSGKVWLINNEDDETELRRRFAAIQKYHNIPWHDLENRIIITGQQKPRFRIATRTATGLIPSPDLDFAINFIKDNDIKALIVDPLVSTHPAEENNNNEMEEILSYYRNIAFATNAAIALVHHTSKPNNASSEGHAGNANAGRGASAVVNAVRISLTLFDMSPQDAARYGISEDKRHLYVRLDDAKANMSLRSPHARWFFKATVDLGNGDKVGVLVPITLIESSISETAAIALSLAEHPTVLIDRQILVSEAVSYLRSSGLFDPILSEPGVRKKLIRMFAMPVSVPTCQDLFFRYWKKDDTVGRGNPSHFIIVE